MEKLPDGTIAEKVLEISEVSFYKSVNNSLWTVYNEGDYRLSTYAEIKLVDHLLEQKEWYNKLLKLEDWNNIDE